MLHVGKVLQNKSGQMAIVAVTVTSILLMTVAISVAAMVMDNYEVSSASIDSTHAYFLAESGIEDSLRRLRENLNYAGGYISSSIGDYNVTITRNANNFLIRSEGMSLGVTRVIEIETIINAESAEITKYSAFSGDFIDIVGGNAFVYGDMWANDDFDMWYSGRLYGNLYAIGKGGFFDSWVYYNAEVLDNPLTPGVIEGDVYSVNRLKVLGNGHVHGDAYSESQIYTSFFGWLVGYIDGTKTPNTDLSFLEEIDVPTFDFDMYRAQATSAGTYFQNAGAFETFLDSYDNGTTRTIPDGIYYIRTGSLVLDAGDSPVVLNGSIVSEKSVYIDCGLEINAQNDLPAIVTKNDLEITDEHYGGGAVTINGLLYSGRDIILRHNEDGQGITINGAAWASDDLYVMENSSLVYDPSVANVQGFGFVTSDSDVEILDWTETL